MNPVVMMRHYYAAVRQELARRFAPEKNARVLELFGNTGRDLLAWETQGADSYVLVDKDYEKASLAADWWYKNVVQVRTSARYVNGESPPPSIRWKPASDMSTRFITIDCFCASNDFETALSLGAEGGRPFDVICAYSPTLPTAFESELKLKALLQNISDRLKIGGFAIFTFPCTERVTQWCKKATNRRAPDGTVGNSIVRFWSDCRYDEGFENHYRYAVKSPDKDCVALKSWFLVDEQILSDLASGLFSMRVVFSAPFDSIVDSTALDSELQDVVWLWKAAVLQKQ